MPFLTLLLVAAAIITVFGIGIYKLGWDNKFTKMFVYSFPLPAAMVNGAFITFRDLEESMRVYQDLDRAQKNKILEKLITDKIVQNLANESGIRVSGGELDQYYKYLLKRLNLPEGDSAKKTENAFSISEREFKKLFVLPDFRQQKYIVSMLENSVEMNKAEKINREIDQGLAFEEAVQMYSEDENSKYIAGSIGFLAEEDIDPWLREDVLKLKKGEISRVLVSPEGYYIVKLVSWNENDAVKKADIRQIFLRGRDFSGYFDEQKSRYRVYTFGKI